MCEATTIAWIGSLFSSGGGAAAGAGAASAGGAAASAGVMGATAASGAGAGYAGATAAASGLTAAETIALASAAVSATGAYQQAKTGKAVAKHNAQAADIAAEEALKAGEKEAQLARRRAGQLLGFQRSALSARSIDISDGSAADALDATNFFGEVDAATSRTNARRAGYGLRSQGRGYQLQAEGYSPLGSGAMTLLTGATSVADQWYRYRRG